MPRFSMFSHSRENSMRSLTTIVMYSRSTCAYTCDTMISTAACVDVHEQVARKVLIFGMHTFHTKTSSHVEVHVDNGN